MPVGLWLLATLLLILIAALLAVTAYSLCAVCTIVRSRRGGVVALPDASSLLTNREGSVHGPLRAIVLCRSERDRNYLVERLKEHYSPYHYHVHTRGRGQPGVVHWIPEKATANDALYIFDDLEAVLQDDADGRVLFDELQRLVDGDRAGDVVQDSRRTTGIRIVFGPPIDGSRIELTGRIVGHGGRVWRASSVPACSVVPMATGPASTNASRS